jgi:methionyl-tRNA formyltransferase
MAYNNNGIIFMGTPEFAAYSLKTLLDAEKNILAVVTAPDKPAGRGRKISQSAVKTFAQSKNIPVLQPVNLKQEEFADHIRDLSPRLIVVVAFRMLPKAIWQIPSLGTINLHASLLPQYRGAAPINWTIMNGERTTGVTTFLIEEQIDTGKILLQKEVPVLEHDNAGSLHDRLMVAGADLLNETIEKILTGSVRQTDQYLLVKDLKSLKSAPKLHRESCRIDWSRSLKEIHNFIRGLSPYPGAWTNLVHQNKTISPVKILQSTILPDANSSSHPGIQTDNRKFIRTSHAEGFLEITELQIPGRKPMPAEEFLKGFRFSEGDCFV